MNKKQLYESIMRNVSREVKKALNEEDSNFYEPAINVPKDPKKANA